MGHPYFTRLLTLTLLWALAVTVLGAYVRLSNAGLGCPDWPGCYGELVIPHAPQARADAAARHPDRPLVAHKAWKEMAHRYAAGGLVVLILALAGTSIRKRLPYAPVLPLALLALIVFQALLGMWTVTLKLKPIIVMGHLLGGFTTVALLGWWRLRLAPSLNSPPSRGRVAVGGGVLRVYTWFALTVLIAQIALGGWTSSNYAALACPDFPLCQGRWWPHTDFSEAFVLWRGLGINYEFGVLESPARAAIHLAHRMGAIIALLTLGTLAVLTLREAPRGSAIRLAAVALLTVLGLQIALGISNVILHLPLSVAVAHNGVAALLLLACITLVFLFNHPSRAPQRA